MSHFFFLAAFKYSICLCLLEVLLSLDVYIFEFILLYVELFGYVDSCLLLNLGSVWPLFLQIFFLTLSLSALLIPIMCVGLLHYCPQTPLGSVHFFFFISFSSCSSGWIILMYIFNSVILSSFCSICS